MKKHLQLGHFVPVLGVLCASSSTSEYKQESVR
jgi:hypothetical protein